jgi:hypothetical protein
MADFHVMEFPLTNSGLTSFLFVFCKKKPKFCLYTEKIKTKRPSFCTLLAPNFLRINTDRLIVVLAKIFWFWQQCVCVVLKCVLPEEYICCQSNAYISMRLTENASIWKRCWKWMQMKTHIWKRILLKTMMSLASIGTLYITQVLRPCPH